MLGYFFFNAHQFINYFFVIIVLFLVRLFCCLFNIVNRHGCDYDALIANVQLFHFDTKNVEQQNIVADHFPQRN